MAKQHHPNIARAEVLQDAARLLRESTPNVAEVLDQVASQLQSDAKRYEQSEELQRIGRNCAESLADMVAALECDYERLEELREEFRALHQDERDAWNEENAEELAELEQAAGECESREDAEQRISEDPLSIELSGTWSLGETPSAERAYILLGTGGPATRIVCELDEHLQPRRAWVQAQDWFQPWTDYVGDGISQDALLTYCGQFYFGDS